MDSFKTDSQNQYIRLFHAVVFLFKTWLLHYPSCNCHNNLSDITGSNLSDVAKKVKKKAKSMCGKHYNICKVGYDFYVCCPFVLVCRQDYIKTTQWISTKLDWRMGLGPE